MDLKKQLTNEHILLFPQHIFPKASFGKKDAPQQSRKEMEREREKEIEPENTDVSLDTGVTKALGKAPR